MREGLPGGGCELGAEQFHPFHCQVLIEGEDPGVVQVRLTLE